MDNETLYHRSFVDVTDSASWRRIYSGPLPTKNTERLPMPGSSAGYQLLPKNLRPMDLFQNPGQDFKMYATSWEKQCSTLLVPHTQVGNYTTLRPVVHPNRFPPGFPVIAHCGEVPAEHIVVPRKYADHNGLASSAHLLSDLLNQGTPAFVTAVTYQSGADWTSLEAGGNTFHYTVITDPEGAILAQVSARGKNDSVEEIDLVKLVLEIEFYLSVGEILVLVGAAARKKLVTAMIRRAEAKKLAKQVLMPSRSFIPKSGMTAEHFVAFQKAAQEENLIAVVRVTNPKSTPLIAKGAPGKPKDLEFLKTSPEDGIVTVTKPLERMETLDKGYFVVGDDKIARRLVRGDIRAGTAIYEELKLKDAFWQVRPGQVLDKELKMPIVGDYDLMGVIKPSNPGQNIALVASDGKLLSDWTNPTVQRFAKNVNGKMGDPKRVLHGAQDQYGGFRGGAVAFMPDGTSTLLETEDAVKGFYDSLGRQPRTGSYGVHTPPADGKYPPLRVVK